MSVEIGQVLDGKYRITRLIGQGGMGAVYEGMHQLIDRRVAIKVLLPHQDESSSERFQQEARAAGRIGNDHILEILDLGALPDGSKYMVCEFLDGEPLSDRIGVNGMLSPERIAPLAIQLLSGLQAAHSAGVLHRDLKPDNIFVLRQKAGKKDFVKIIDFGISKFSQADGGDGLSMTKTGMMVGTPNYMSPEQARGLGNVDARADLYAVGVILYEAVSGQLPYSAETFNDLIFKVVLEEPTPLEELVPDVPRDFVAIVKKGMARDPDNRFSTADEFAGALQDWGNTHGIEFGSASGINPSVAPRNSHGPTRMTPLARDTGSAMTTIVQDALDPALLHATISNNKPTATPGAFGTTSPHHVPEHPAWWNRRATQLGIIAALVGVLLLTLGIVLSRDEPAAETAAAAAAETTPPAAEEPRAEVEPSAPTPDTTAQDTKDKETTAEASTRPEAVVDVKVPAPPQKNAPSTTQAIKPPGVRVVTRPVAAPNVLPEPKPEPPPPAVESKRRVDFGY